MKENRMIELKICRLGLITCKVDNKDYPIREDNIFNFFDENVTLEEGFTLRSYFKMVERYPLLQKFDCYFPEYIREYRECPPSGCIDDLDCIEMTKVVDITVSEKYDLRDLTVYNDIHGLGKEDQGYAIEFTPLHEILDVPFKLGNCVEIRYKDELESNEYETSFTFFEFLKAIIWELSFMGNPNERDASFTKIKEDVKEIKEYVDKNEEDK
jgi:hypothetical protein